MITRDQQGASVETVSELGDFTDGILAENYDSHV